MFKLTQLIEKKIKKEKKLKLEKGNIHFHR